MEWGLAPSLGSLAHGSRPSTAQLRLPSKSAGPAAPWNFPHTHRPSPHHGCWPRAPCTARPRPFSPALTWAWLAHGAEKRTKGLRDPAGQALPSPPPRGQSQGPHHRPPLPLVRKYLHGASHGQLRILEGLGAEKTLEERSLEGHGGDWMGGRRGDVRRPPPGPQPHGPAQPLSAAPSAFAIHVLGERQGGPRPAPSPLQPLGLPLHPPGDIIAI